LWLVSQGIHNNNRRIYKRTNEGGREGGRKGEHVPRDSELAASHGSQAAGKHLLHGGVRVGDEVSGKGLEVRDDLREGGREGGREGKLAPI
jgi:hypothetical protein